MSRELRRRMSSPAAMSTMGAGASAPLGSSSVRMVPRRRVKARGGPELSGLDREEPPDPPIQEMVREDRDDDEDPGPESQSQSRAREC
jgi:hypothetical protein